MDIVELDKIISWSEYVGGIAVIIFVVVLLLILIPKIWKKYDIKWEPGPFKRYALSPDVATRLLGVCLGLLVLSYILNMFDL